MNVLIRHALAALSAATVALLAHRAARRIVNTYDRNQEEK